MELEWKEVRNQQTKEKQRDFQNDNQSDIANRKTDKRTVINNKRKSEGAKSKRKWKRTKEDSDKMQQRSNELKIKGDINSKRKNKGSKSKKKAARTKRDCDKVQLRTCGHGSKAKTCQYRKSRKKGIKIC